jgi:hypothetical protein
MKERLPPLIFFYASQMRPVTAKNSSRCNFRLLQHNLPEADIARTTNRGLAAMDFNPAFNYATAFEFDFCFSSSP